MADACWILFLVVRCLTKSESWRATILLLLIAKTCLTAFAPKKQDSYSRKTQDSSRSRSYADYGNGYAGLAAISLARNYHNLTEGVHSDDEGVFIFQGEVDEQLYVRHSRMTDEQRLLGRLLRNYDRNSRPVFSDNETVTVTVSLTLTQIFELDEKNQVLISNAWVNLEWYDKYLIWDPSEYSGLEMVRVISRELWLPDIVLYNNAADFSRKALETRAMVSNIGFVFWAVPTKLFSSCKIDVSFFPFDEQICPMKFGSWTYDGFRVDLVNGSREADLELFMKNGEWDLLKADQRRSVIMYTCCIEPYPDVTFNLHIRRKPLYYTINLFVPCMLLSVLTLLLFHLPAESTERCGLGVTVMLSYSMFMFTVFEKLPDTSESVPLISVYLITVMSTTAVSIVITVVLLILNYRTSRGNAMKPWLKNTLDCLSSFRCVAVLVPETGETEYQIRGFSGGILAIRDKCCRSQKNKIRHPKHHPSLASMVNNLSIVSTIIGEKSLLTPTDLLHLLASEVTDTADICNRFSPEYRKVAMGLYRLVDRQQKEVYSLEVTATWRQLAKQIDKVLFWLILFISSFFTAFLLEIYPNYSRKT